MTFLGRFMSLNSLLLAATLLTAAPVAGQAVTTGTISGTVVDPQGGALPGAVILATHTPTGTAYQAVTQGDGRFALLNVRVGPYNVKVTMSGFKEQEQKDVDVALGAGSDGQLQAPARDRDADRDGDAGRRPPIDTVRAGTAANISQQAIDNLPTITRSISRTIARTNRSFVALNRLRGRRTGHQRRRPEQLATTACRSTAPSTTTSSASAHPARRAATAGTQPVSLDAIQESRSSSRPTTSGRAGFPAGRSTPSPRAASNSYHGTALLLRAQSGLGGRRHHLANPIPEIRRTSRVASASAARSPQTRLFFFGTLDNQRKTTPTGFSSAAAAGQFNLDALVDQFLSICKNTVRLRPRAEPEGEFSRRQQ